MYVIRLNDRYYFNRRVPKELVEYDAREKVRFALKTDSRKEAVRLAMIHNERLESYWQQLVNTGNKHAHDRYEAVVKRTRLFGFSYMPAMQLSQIAMPEILERFFHVEKENFAKTHVEAVLGGVEQPNIKLDDALNRYWEYAKDKTYNKSPQQFYKWKAPRKNAVKNFTNVVGNKIITQISRDDVLKFRDWWLNRIQALDLGTNGANKNFVHLKVILETVSDNLNLKLDVDNLFKKILLPEDEQKRLPFTTEYIREHLLNPENLSGLKEQAKYALYAFSETGAGPAELVALKPKDIVLDADIPYIIIRPGKFNDLKTKYRKRIIPLVGYALEAFRKFPEGFTDYQHDPDGLSSDIGDHLRKNNLLPSENHTLYSLRHSFQDRLLAANAPDRVQTDLMGHKFQREDYGNGASIQQKFEWLKKIKLK